MLRTGCKAFPRIDMHLNQCCLSQQYSIKDTIIGQKLVVMEEDEELLWPPSPYLTYLTVVTDKKYQPKLLNCAQPTCCGVLHQRILRKDLRAWSKCSQSLKAFLFSCTCETAPNSGREKETDLTQLKHFSALAHTKYLTCILKWFPSSLIKEFWNNF